MSDATSRAEPGVLDPNALESIRTLQSDGAPDLLARVVRLYLESVPELIERLRTGLAAGDHVSVRTAAHTLKSSSANVGAVRLAELCKQLELAARAGTFDPGLPDADAVEREYAAVRTALEAGIGETTA